MPENPIISAEAEESAAGQTYAVRSDRGYRSASTAELLDLYSTGDSYMPIDMRQPTSAELAGIGLDNWVGSAEELASKLDSTVDNFLRQGRPDGEPDPLEPGHMRIGFTSLPYGPENIKIIDSRLNQLYPAMRSGAAGIAKSGRGQVRIEMDIDFPANQLTQLRYLIAQFRNMPIVPLENDYIVNSLAKVLLDNTEEHIEGSKDLERSVNTMTARAMRSFVSILDDIRGSIPSYVEGMGDDGWYIEDEQTEVIDEALSEARSLVMALEGNDTDYNEEFSKILSVIDKGHQGAIILRTNPETGEVFSFMEMIGLFTDFELITQELRQALQQRNLAQASSAYYEALQNEDVHLRAVPVILQQLTISPAAGSPEVIKCKLVALLFNSAAFTLYPTYVAWNGKPTEEFQDCLHVFGWLTDRFLTPGKSTYLHMPAGDPNRGKLRILYPTSDIIPIEGGVTEQMLREEYERSIARSNYREVANFINMPEEEDDSTRPNLIGFKLEGATYVPVYDEFLINNNPEQFAESLLQGSGGTQRTNHPITITGISVTIENHVSVQPVQGCPYPAYQHLGTANAVVSIDFVISGTKQEHDQALQYMNGFKREWERVASIAGPSFRRQAFGAIQNDIINMAGMRAGVLDTVVLTTDSPQQTKGAIRLIEFRSAPEELERPNLVVDNKSEVVDSLKQLYETYIKNAQRESDFDPLEAVHLFGIEVVNGTQIPTDYTEAEGLRLLFEKAASRAQNRRPHIYSLDIIKDTLLKNPALFYEWFGSPAEIKEDLNSLGVVLPGLQSEIETLVERPALETSLMLAPLALFATHAPSLAFAAGESILEGSYSVVTANEITNFYERWAAALGSDIQQFNRYFSLENTVSSTQYVGEQLPLAETTFILLTMATLLYLYWLTAPNPRYDDADYIEKLPFWSAPSKPDDIFVREVIDGILRKPYLYPTELRVLIYTALCLPDDSSADKDEAIRQYTAYPDLNLPTYMELYGNFIEELQTAVNVNSSVDDVQTWLRANDSFSAMSTNSTNTAILIRTKRDLDALAQSSENVRRTLELIFPTYRKLGLYPPYGHSRDSFARGPLDFVEPDFCWFRHSINDREFIEWLGNYAESSYEPVPGGSREGQRRNTVVENNELSVDREDFILRSSNGEEATVSGIPKQYQDMADVNNIYKRIGSVAKSSGIFDTQDPAKARALMMATHALRKDDYWWMARAYPTVKVFFIKPSPFKANGMLEVMADELFGYNAVSSVQVIRHKFFPDTAEIELVNTTGSLDPHEYFQKRLLRKRDPREIAALQAWLSSTPSSERREFIESLGIDEEASAYGELPPSYIEQFDAAGYNRTTQRRSDNGRTASSTVPFFLTEGMMVQVRMGYSTRIDELDVVFNGQIAEIQFGDIIRIVGQAYSSELTTPVNYHGWETGDGGKGEYAYAARAVMSQCPAIHYGPPPGEDYDGLEWSDFQDFLGRAEDFFSSRAASVNDRDTLEIAGSLGRRLSNIYVAPIGVSSMVPRHEYIVPNVPGIQVFHEFTRLIPGIVCQADVPFGTRATCFVGYPSQMYWAKPTDEVRDDLFRWTIDYLDSRASAEVDNIEIGANALIEEFLLDVGLADQIFDYNGEARREFTVGGSSVGATIRKIAGLQEQTETQNAVAILDRLIESVGLEATRRIFGKLILLGAVGRRGPGTRAQSIASFSIYRHTIEDMNLHPISRTGSWHTYMQLLTNIRRYRSSDAEDAITYFDVASVTSDAALNPILADVRRSNFVYPNSSEAGALTRRRDALHGMTITQGDIRTIEDLKENQVAKHVLYAWHMFLAWLDTEESEKIDDLRQVKDQEKSVLDISNMHPQQRPFRLHHYANSVNHIIHNGIICTRDEMANVVVVRYPDPSSFFASDTGVDVDVEGDKVYEISDVDWTSWEQAVDPSNLKPENRKVRTVTEINLEARNSAEVLCGFANLAEALRPMYRGELLIRGNGAIKPYDIVWLDDAYNSIKGPIEVEYVIHRFNRQEGFVSAISPHALVIPNSYSDFTQSCWQGLAIISTAVAVWGTALAITAASGGMASIPAITTAVSLTTAIVSAGTVTYMYNDSKDSEKRDPNNSYWDIIWGNCKVSNEEGAVQIIPLTLFGQPWQAGLLGSSSWGRLYLDEKTVDLFEDRGMDIRWNDMLGL